MKTERTEITRNIYVYAEAKTNYQLDNLSPGELPFEYEFKAYDYGHEGSVRIMEQPVTIVVPAGIDITSECIKNLHEKIEGIRKDAQAEIDKIEERIRNMALIEYNPEE